MSLYLNSLAFHALPTPLTFPREDLNSCFAQIASLVEKQTTKVVSGLSPVQQSEINRHFLCSTMVELPFTSGAIQWQDVAKHWQHSEAPNPSSFINAYECASWGYSLRYYFKQNPDARYVIVSIIDANALNFKFWHQNENWGHSGFGLCTLLFENRQDDISTQACISAGCAMTYNSTPEFATVVRRKITGRDDLTMSLPFFPESIRQIFDKLLASGKRLPDQHDKWGHCFGSDPWIGILEQGIREPFTSKQTILASSIALNGYYCMAEVIVDEHTDLMLNLDDINVEQDLFKAQLQQQSAAETNTVEVTA